MTYPEFFEAGRYIGQTQEDAKQENISKFVIPDALKMYSLALSILRILRKTFSKLLKGTAIHII